MVRKVPRKTSVPAAPASIGAAVPVTPASVDVQPDVPLPIVGVGALRRRTGSVGSDGTIFHASLDCVSQGLDTVDAMTRGGLNGITERERANALLEKSEEFNRAVLDSLSDNIAVLDERGVILAVNRAWSQFALDNGAPQSVIDAIGVNYFSVCRQAIHGPFSEGAVNAVAGINAVLVGEQSEFRMEYPCHSPDEQRWFLMHVTALQDSSIHAVVRHLNITTRKLAELALKESEARSRAIFDHAVDAIVTIDERGIIESVNHAGERMFGYSDVEVIGKNVSMLMPSPYREMHDNHLAHYLQTAKKKIIGTGREVVGLRKDGTQFPLYMSVAEVLLPGRRIFTGMLCDITERKRAEDALRESEAQNRALVNAIPDPILTIGRDGEYLAVHSSDPTALLGPAETFLRRRVEDVLPQPIAARFMEALANALDLHAMQELRYEIPGQGVEKKYFEARLAPSTEDTVICIVRDVTVSERERRSQEFYTSQLSYRLDLSETELRERDQLLALAADAASLGVWTHDVAQDEFSASHYWHMLFGFTPSQRLNKASVFERVHPEDRLAFGERVNLATKGDGVYENDYRIVRPDGEVRWISSLGRVEFDADHRPILIRGVSSDITQRKQVEFELEQKRSEVAYLSRLAMLAELSGALAHELNQPLMSILINAEAAQLFVAQNGGDHKKLNDILQDIVDEDNRASEIIRHLRQLFSKQETVRESIDGNELTSDVYRILRNDLINRGVTLKMELAPDMHIVNVDRLQTEQVLINLIMNASDAVESADAALRQIIVRTTRTEDKRLQISVIDQGPGIAAEVLERIFDPFFTTKARGMGLGLSICRNIVNANGGRLWVENNPVRGASFHFILPLMLVETA